MKTHILLLAAVASSVLVACAGNPSSPQARRCAAQLDIAAREMKVAKAKRARGHVNLTKAAGLLAAAQVQYEFGKYPNCLIKAKRARAFIRISH